MAISSRAPARGRRGVREAIGLTRDDEGTEQPRAQTTAKRGRASGAQRRKGTGTMEGARAPPTRREGARERATARPRSFA